MGFYSSALDTIVTAMNNKQVPTGMPFNSVPEQQGLPASHMDFLLRATTCDVYYGQKLDSQTLVSPRNADVLAETTW